MAGIPFSLPSEFTTFQTKFQDMTKELGNTCSTFGALGGLTATNPEAILKNAMLLHMNAASEIHKILSGFTGNITTDGLTMVTNALTSFNTLMTTFVDTTKNITGVISDATNTIKMATCTHAATIIKNLPVTVRDASPSATVIGNYTFTQSGGRNIIGKFDIDAMTTSTATAQGAPAMVETIKSVGDQSQLILNQIKTVSQFRA